MREEYPRLIIAGTKGDSGKTMVSLGLILALRDRGFDTSAFKKGPDFIDAAWLGWASGGIGRNLDTYMMGTSATKRSFFQHALPNKINVVEGNRGLHDGSDPQGTHSTAELAKLLGAPVILVLPVTKTTRTAAAWVLGCKMLDPDVNIAGVILNRCAGPRHKRVTTEAIEAIAGVPVLGAIPKLAEGLVPNRHLGLVTLAEHTHVDKVKKVLSAAVADYVDIDRIVEIARNVPPAPKTEPYVVSKMGDGKGLTFGVIEDSAFSFYYPENIEALEQSGAKIVKISALNTKELPAQLNALYIGGGFPETHLEQLCANRGLMRQVKQAAENGLPVYAECGGLMYLSRSVKYHGVEYPMTGVLSLDLDVSKKPRGHGYCDVRVDRENPFFEIDTLLKGHEFHYSGIVSGAESAKSAFSVKRGTGCFEGRDGMMEKNVLASYLHLHAEGSPEWTKGMIRAARNHANHQGQNRGGNDSEADPDHWRSAAENH